MIGIILFWSSFHDKDLYVDISKNIIGHNSRNLHENPSFEPIRIKINYDYIDGTKNDSQSCTFVGQNVYWKSKNFVCTQDDILTAEKIHSIKSNMDNVKNFLEKFLKVIPWNRNILLESHRNFVDFDITREFDNTDFLITFASRPYDDPNKLITRYINSRDPLFKRPLHVMILINPRNINVIIGSEKTPDQSVEFYKFLGAVIRSLAMTRTSISYFHPKYDPDQYDVMVCQMTKYNKKFNILITPYAHAFAVKNYGREWFNGTDKSCPSGIILDDNMGYPSGAHYIQEATVLTFLQNDSGRFNRITDISMAFLLDSGNFEVDWKMAQPLIHGNKDAIDGNFVNDWPLSPPSTAFPDSFYDPHDQNNTVSHDFNSWGKSDTIELDCQTNNKNSVDKKICSASEWYNPKNLSIRTDQAAFSYQVTKSPSNVCPPGKATIPGLTYYSNDYCASYSCNGYSSFSLNVTINERTNETKTYTCTKKGESFSFTRTALDGGKYSPKTITCPSPEQFCRSRNLIDAHFTSNPFPNVVFPQKRPKPNKPSPKPTPSIIFDQRFEPIRITRDYKFINKSSQDENMCKEVGTSITTGFGTYKCTKHDIMTEEKVQNVIGTLENVFNFLSKFLRVIPNHEPFRTAKDSLSTTYIEETIENSDLHFTFTAPPMNESNSSFYVSKVLRNNDSMVYSMNCYINPRQIPEFISSDSNENATFYFEILSQIVKALAVDGISNFHPRFSSNKYPDPICTFNKNNVDFRVLVTPYAHRFGVYYYGTEWFEGERSRCPSGILLDSENRPLPSRYLGELLIYPKIDNHAGRLTRVSDVTMAYLFDTGNYDIDYRMAKPLIYGNKDFIDGNIIQGWPLDNPMVVLPNKTFRNPNDAQNSSAGWSFFWWGRSSSLISNDCQNLSSTYSKYCNNTQYYNPFNFDKLPTTSSFDYIIQNIPTKYCKQGEATIPGMTYFDEEICGRYECNGYSSFTIEVTVDIVTGKRFNLTCTQEGQTRNYPLISRSGTQYRRELYCPSPERFCKIMNDQDTPFLNDPYRDVVMPSRTPTKTPKMTPKIQHQDTNDGYSPTDPFERVIALAMAIYYAC